MPEALIIDAVRTPMGRYRGALAGVRPDDLAAHVIARGRRAHRDRPGRGRRRLLGRRQPGRRGQPRRRADGVAARRAARSRSRASPSTGSAPPGSRRSTRPSRALRLGEGDLYLAGGVESMSRAPWVMPKPEAGAAARRADAARHDARLAADQPARWRSATRPRRWARRPRTSPSATGSRATTRTRFALRSHQRAVAAQSEGRFAERDRPGRRPGPQAAARPSR